MEGGDRKQRHGSKPEEEQEGLRVGQRSAGCYGPRQEPSGYPLLFDANVAGDFHYTTTNLVHITKTTKYYSFKDRFRG